MTWEIRVGVKPRKLGVLFFALKAPIGSPKRITNLDQ